MAFRLSMSPMRELFNNMFNEFFFFISGSAAVGVSPLEWEVLKPDFRSPATELGRGVFGGAPEQAGLASAGA